MDPLGAMEIGMEIDKAFTITTSEKDCEGVKTVQHAIDGIKQNQTVKY